MRRWLVIAAVLVGVLLAAGAGSAAAAPEPDPGAQVVAQPAEGEGFGDRPVVDRYGISVYDYEIQPRQGGGVDGTFNRLGLWLADVLFSASRFIVVALVWLLDFALTFGLAELMLTPVEQVIGAYENNFVGTLTGGGLGLVPLALMICVFWFGLAALRGRVGRGVGEITLSFVLAVLLGAILANPGGTLLDESGLVGRAKDIGVDVAVTAVQPPGADPPACVQQVPAGEALVDGCFLDEFGNGEPPTRNDPQYLRWVMQMWLVDMYIRRPHQQMAYGQRLDCPLVLTVRGTETTAADQCEGPYEDGGNHPCVGAYNDILRTNAGTAPEAAGADPESYMYDMMHPDEPLQGCPEGAELASYLDRGTGDRVVLGLLLLFALLVLAMFMVVGVLIPIIVGQLMVAILAVALVFVLPIALLGGGARRILWRWFGLLLAAAFLLIVALVGLALMLITTELLLQGHHRFLFLNLLMVCISSVLFLTLQRRMLRGALSGGSSVGGALSRVRIGGSAGPGGGAVDTAGWSRVATMGYRPMDRIRSSRQDRRSVQRNLRISDRWQRRHK